MTEMADHTFSGNGGLSEEPELAMLGPAAAAEAIRNGEVTSEAYATILLRQARKRADLNAFTVIDEAEILSAAREADRARAAGSSLPLLGVPFGVKDSYLTAGLPTSLGLKSLAGFLPREDADAVRAIKEAGAFVFGKNNLVEMSFGLTGHNEHFGQVVNPTARDRVSGGSSSGSAAAVAAGIVPASLGGDTVGSIRVPASLCGVVGYKPTTERWPRGGVAPLSPTLDTTGVLARCVEDCALVDQIVTGERPSGDAVVPDDLRGVRLVYAPRHCLALVEPEVEARFCGTMRQLVDAGAEIVELDLGPDFGALSLSAAWSVFFYETMEAVSEFLHRHNVPVTFEAIVESLKPELQGAWRYMVLPGGGGATSDEAYQLALTVSRTEIQRRLQAAFAETGAQAILQPTTPCVAPLIDQRANFMIAGREVSDLVLANHTVVASLLGLPGISLPMELPQGNLPMGIELDAPRGHDRALLTLARRIEDVLRSQLS